MSDEGAQVDDGPPHSEGGGDGQEGPQRVVPECGLPELDGAVSPEKAGQLQEKVEDRAEDQGVLGDHHVHEAAAVHDEAEEEEHPEPVPVVLAGALGNGNHI